MWNPSRNKLEMELCATSWEFIPESEWRPSYGKHVSPKATYIFKINSLSLSLSDWSIHPYSHQLTFNNKNSLPWSRASVYGHTNADKKDNTPSACQSSHICVCTWWKQRLSVGRRVKELRLRTRHSHSACCLKRKPRVQDDFVMTNEWS